MPLPYSIFYQEHDISAASCFNIMLASFPEHRTEVSEVNRTIS